jgi:uncharacterized membrane protein
LADGKYDTHPGDPQFDPYPFGFLTLSVSLEAIFLSVFVLLSQNRQAAKDRVPTSNTMSTSKPSWKSRTSTKNWIA